MGNLAEIRLSPGPQQHIWTTPFWLHIRPTGTLDHDLGFHEWDRLLSSVDHYRDDLIDDPSRPCSWEECEAPEVLPRTLVETTIHEIIRRIASSPHLFVGNYINHIAHVPGIIERNPVFLWGKLPCRRSIFLLLQVGLPQIPILPVDPTPDRLHLCSHNCPPVSLQGILTDGIIRPSSWKHAREVGS